MAWWETGRDEPAPKATEETTPNENSRAPCAIVMSAIALIFSMLCMAGLVWLAMETPSKGNDINNKVDVNVAQTRLTTQTSSNNQSSAVYIRWGRTRCPTTASLVYTGIAGGKWFQDAGSGSNYLCLPETPEYDDYQQGPSAAAARVFSVEYQTEYFPPFEDIHQYDVPCVVCNANGRISLMIPAKMTCPDNSWTREYHGYLMAEKYNHKSTEFVCVDRNPEIRPDGMANQDGALFYPVEGRCVGSNLPCGPYINGAELTCVVCTK